MKKQPRKPGKGAAKPADDPSGVQTGSATPADDRFGVQTGWLPLMAYKPPYWANELARLAAALLPESVKQGLAAADLWPELKRGYFPPIKAMDNAIAARPPTS